MGGLATRAVRVGGLALVVGALAGRATVAQPVVETRLLAGVHFIEMLTAGAKTQERLPLVVALHPQRGDAADFIALGGHDELRLAVAGGPADDVSQFHLPPRRKSGFLPLPTQAFVAVVAFAHARTAILDFDHKHRAGLLQWKLDLERL